MNIITKEVQIKKTKKINEIEEQLKKFGEPLRYAIVKTDDNWFYIEGAFLVI